MSEHPPQDQRLQAFLQLPTSDDEAGTLRTGFNDPGWVNTKDMSK